MDEATTAGVGPVERGLGPLPAGLLTVESRAGIAHAGGMRRYEPIQALPDGEHKLYAQGALDAAVAAERARWIGAVLEALPAQKAMAFIAHATRA